MAIALGFIFKKQGIVFVFLIPFSTFVHLLKRVKRTDGFGEMGEWLKPTVC